jgi:hypothetical protein
MELKEIAKEINQLISQYQIDNSLSFVEDTHTYFIKGEDGQITSDMPSVSTVLHCFYTPFNAQGTRAFKNCEGDKEKERLLLETWAATGEYASNMGSRVHYNLEKHLVGQYGNYKEVRQPIFVCDEEQTNTGDQMIIAGKKFIDVMHSRGAVLLDTEIVLGNVELGYFGQPDKMWLIKGKSGNPGIVITDWKTNKEKNFEVHAYTTLMKPPFQHLYDTALAHYYIQLPLYGKLLLKMLEGTKYADIPLLGAVVILLRPDATYEEFKVPSQVVKTVLDMDVKSYLNEKH